MICDIVEGNDKIFLNNLHVFNEFAGGMNSRGDQKWPPAEHKQQVDEENEQRKAIAAGPAFRPKRVNKVVRSFMY